MGLPTPPTFDFRGQRYPYLDHGYNYSRQNERAIEVPIAVAFMKSQRGSGVEVGHVTGHYAPRPYGLTVVDRDEQAPGVINADIREWSPPGPFDWLVSVSTIEHVGWAPPAELDPHAAAPMLDRLRQFVKPGAPMLVTVPLGFNPGMDVHLLDTQPEGSTMVTDDGHFWHEEPGVVYRPYGRTTPCAQSVWIGVWP